jgi:hypothetical protein
MSEHDQAMIRPYPAERVLAAERSRYNYLAAYGA